MNVKLEEIRDQHPCADGWKRLVKSLDGRTEGNVSLSHILDSNGIEDAIWCLRVLPYRDQCLFRADVAELVVHLSHDPRPKKAIAAIRQWHSGEIGDQAFNDAADAAYDAVTVTGLSDATAYAAIYAAYVASDVASDTASDTATYATAIYAAYVVDAATWLKITTLFKKHYCEGMK